MTDTQPTNSNGLSGADMLALITHITALLSEMEGRIMDRLAGNATGATERWGLHEKAHHDDLVRADARFLKIENALNDHLVVANAHFKKANDEEVAMDARVQPVRTTFVWIVAHWAQIVMFLVFLLGFFALAADVLSRYIGGQS